MDALENMCGLRALGIRFFRDDVVVRRRGHLLLGKGRRRKNDNKLETNKRRRRRTSGRTTLAESRRSTSLTSSDQQLGSELHFSEPVDPTWQRRGKKRTGMRKVTAVAAVCSGSHDNVWTIEKII